LWLSVLWAGLGAAGAGYAFFLSTKHLAVGMYLPQWDGESGVIVRAGTLAALTWLLLTVPVLVAGFIRLRGGRPSNGRVRAAVWAGAWVAGLALMYLVSHWQASPPAIDTCDKFGCALSGYGPSAVSWRELAVCAGYLALGAVMARMMAGHHNRRLTPVQQDVRP
jgi:hypothetical protein